MSDEYQWQWPLEDMAPACCGAGCSASRNLSNQTSISKELKLTEPGTIRLIDLHPGLPSDPLRCKLLRCSLTQAPEYDAISYTWGNKMLHWIIWINDSPYAITFNAHAALHRLRHGTKHRLYWLDSICIDQDSDEDKKSQIDLMASIFHKARRVVAWLDNQAKKTTIRSSISELSASLIGFSITPKRPNNLESGWNALFEFFKNPWFNRVWVMQEIATATAIFVVYGPEVIDWDELRTVVRNLFNPVGRSMVNFLTLQEKKRLSREFPSEMVHITHVSMMRDSMRGGSPRTWSTAQMAGQMLYASIVGDDDDGDVSGDGTLNFPLCDMFRRCGRTGASEAKDKIFALLSLSSEANLAKTGLWKRSPLPVSTSVYSIDYSMPTSHIFTKCALRILTNETSPFRTPLNVLPSAGIGYAREFKTLPSWVPDWSCLPEAWMLSFDRGNNGNYRASGPLSNLIHFNTPLPGEATGTLDLPFLLYGTPTSTKRQYGFVHPMPGQILLQGVQLDEILALSECFAPKIEEKDLSSSLDVMISWFSQTLKLVETFISDPYPNGQSKRTAYWRSLIGDRSSQERWPAPPEYETFYNGHLNLLRQSLLFCSRKKDAITFQNGSRETIPFLEEILNVAVTPYGEALQKAAAYRRFCVTKNGYMGLVPPAARKGDEISIPLGAQTPFVLRRVSDDSNMMASNGIVPQDVWQAWVDEMSISPKSDDMKQNLQNTTRTRPLSDVYEARENVFQLVGECYIHGMMDGEGMGDAVVDGEINAKSAFLKIFTIR